MIARTSAVVLISLLAVAAGGAAAAQSEFEVFATIEPADGITDTRPLRLSVTVEGTSQASPSLGSLPPFENLRVISGPDRSTAFSFVNGRTRSTTVLTFTLVAERPGRATIPQIPVRVGNRTYLTEPIEIEVGSSAGGSGGRQAPARRDADPLVDLDASISPREVWLGEPAVLEVVLLAGAPVGSPSWIEVPSFSDFWTEDVETDPDLERYRTEVRGRSYVAYPMSRKVLVPNREGNLEIGSYVIQIQVRAPGTSRDPFGDLLGFGRVRTEVRKTSPLVLRVKPLPEDGAPDGFSGAVGRFTMRAAIDREEAEENEAIPLRVTIEGTGSLQGISAPRLEGSADVQVFEPKLVEESTSIRKGLVSRRTWEWVLVPLTPGSVRLPGPVFSFFDTETGSYRSLGGETIALDVRRGATPRDTVTVRSDVRAVRRDIAFIKPLRGALRDASPRVHRRGWFLALAAFPLLATPVLIVVGRRRERLARDRGLVRARRSRGKARKRLKAIGARASRLDSAAFHEEVSRALIEFVGDRFDRAASGLTYDAVDELLEGGGVAGETRRRLRASLERCDFARFVPESAGGGDRARVIEDALEVVDAIEEEL